VEAISEGHGGVERHGGRCSGGVRRAGNVGYTVEAGGALEATGTLEANVAGRWCIGGPAWRGGGFHGEVDAAATTVG
jgi:hypothetical protein